MKLKNLKAKTTTPEETPQTETETKSKKFVSKVERDDREVKASWDRLARVMRAAGEEVFVPNPNGPISYHEIRAIRYVYCVLGWRSQDIAKATGRTYNSINSIIQKRRLRALRKRIDEQITRKAVTGVAKDVEEVTALTAAALKRYLTDVVRTEHPLTPKDAKLISDIGANFHRILQLIKGKPTSISKAAEMTDEAATEMLIVTLKQMQQDPMFDMQKFLAELHLPPDALKAAEAAASGVEDDEKEGDLFDA